MIAVRNGVTDAVTSAAYDLALSQEEVVLRRKLLFRLLRDFDFARPRLRGEFISDPVRARTGAPAPIRDR